MPILNSMTRPFSITKSTAARLALLLALGSSLTGCTSTNPDQGRVLSPDARAEAVPRFTDEFGKVGFRLDWRGFPTMLPGEKLDRLEILGDVVVAQESAGVVTVLETASGVTRWSDQPAGRLTKFVGNVRTPESLLVSSESDVYVYDISSGALKSRQKLDQVVNTRPVKAGEVLVYGCANGQVLGHYLRSGMRIWGSGLRGSVEINPVELPNGRLAMLSTAGDLAVLDGVTGTNEARARIFLGAEAPMAASDRLLFVASSDQSLYVFNHTTGQQLWRQRTDAPLKNAPVFVDGRVYCDMGSMGLTAYEAGTGKLIWNNKEVAGKLVTTRNKRLVIFTGTELVLLNPTNGKIIERAPIPGISMVVADGLIDGSMYTVSPLGVVAKYVGK